MVYRVYHVASNNAVLFFFKPNTAYVMRISDWSSDVCSADLLEQDDRILVDRDHLAPAFERLVLDHRAVDDARGIGKRRELPKGPNRRLDSPRPARSIGDIQPHE